LILRLHPPPSLRPPVLAAFALIAGMLLLAKPARAQLTFPGASPISAGNVIVRVQPEIASYTGDLRSITDKTVLIYGASPALAFIVQNYTLVANSAPVETGGKHETETALGFGDTLLQARYTIFQRDGIGSTFRIAPYVGVVVPTGMTAANTQLPRGAQPGMGAWASRDALTMSYQTLFWNGGAEVGYQANSAGGDYRFGNTFFADLGFHALLWPHNLEGVVPAELYASLEANYIAGTANRESGAKVPGTGAHLLLLDPGLIYSTPTYSFSATAFLPAWERVRDNGARFVYGLELFMRLSFFTSHHF
jgi:hypothetical protein